jgi:hypothetical protein
MLQCNDATSEGRLPIFNLLIESWAWDLSARLASCRKRYKKPIRCFLGKFAIDIRLLPAEGIALGNAALCRLDTAPATPAKPLSRVKSIHQLTWMMSPAGIAEKSFRHNNLAQQWNLSSKEWR